MCLFIEWVFLSHLHFSLCTCMFLCVCARAFCHLSLVRRSLRWWRFYTLSSCNNSFNVICVCVYVSVFVMWTTKSVKRNYLQELYVIVLMICGIIKYICCVPYQPQPLCFATLSILCDCIKWLQIINIFPKLRSKQLFKR